MPFTSGFASPSPDELVPIIAVIAVMVVPIIVILTRHQQKMTMLMHQKGESLGPALQELYSLQNVVQELKSTVSNLALNVDSLKGEVRNNSSIHDRIKVGE
jgi:uncharacterized protein YlxW (UPF0749 family)